MTSASPVHSQAAREMAAWLAPHMAVLWPLAEEWFGPGIRNGRHFGGFHFRDAGAALDISARDPNEILIGLDRDCETNRDWALLSMAHELTHCLGAQPEGLAPMIEEGCCVLFSLVAPTFPTPGYGDAALQLLVNSPEEAHYAEALFAAKELSGFAPDAVRLLRAIEPHWDQITPEMIRRELPAVPEDLAAVLCEQRDMHGPYRPSAWWTMRLAERGSRA